MKRLADRLAEEKRIAVDLEADSLHHYEEKVCLLQITADGETHLIDTLRVPDISSLQPVFGERAIEKILHGADYDVRMLERGHGITLENLFDTMIAAQLLGKKAVGLAALLQERFSVVLDKRYQKADWSRRPLSEEMIHYAAEDTAHLVALRDQLAEELEAKSRMTWAREEFRLITGKRSSPKKEPSCLAIKGAYALDPRQLAVLQTLVEFRDREARRLDRPPFKVMGNSVLLEIARRRPPDRSGLGGIVGLTPKLVDRYGEALLENVRIGEAVPDARCPKFPRSRGSRPGAGQVERFKKLSEARNVVARSLELDPSFLCTKAGLDALAAAKPEMFSEAMEEVLKRWQRKLLEGPFREALAGPAA